MLAELNDCIFCVLLYTVQSPLSLAELPPAQSPSTSMDDRLTIPGANRPATVFPGAIQWQSFMSAF
jgi:hypothetical protein